MALPCPSSAGPGAAGIRIKKFYSLIFYKGMLFLLKYL
jgi:hypothetical protein